ncbi:MAG: hypothetical protein HY002_04525 [Candidatus Rokubacteria bacterium]|nr:hypothetical protein [Candidatus Rokubacteria bacterium]
MESLAVSWLFPGKPVAIQARCLDCAEPLGVRMRDGRILEARPRTIVGHLNTPFPRWGDNWPHT